MRNNQLLAFAVVALAASGVLAASAFNSADLGTRAVTAEVVNDNVGYLALERNGASPHRCFVTPTSTAKIAITFGSNSACPDRGGADAGTGINPTSWYTFHDLLNVTNLGTVSVTVSVVATTTSGSSSALTVAVNSAANTMVDADYAAAPAGILLAVGDKMYIGVKTDAGTLESGQVTGTIHITATDA